MNNDKLLEEFLSLKGKHYLLELPTGTGKSRLTIEKIKSLYNNETNILLLIVVSRRVHIQTWQDELDKWWKNCPLNITIITYNSLHKYANYYDAIILDEVQHFSERCAELFLSYRFDNIIMCSATVPMKLKHRLQLYFNPLIIIKRDLRNVINKDMLPDPLIYLLPLTLNNDPLNLTDEYIIHPNAKNDIYVKFKDRGKYINNYNLKLHVQCTQKEYYSYLTKQVQYYKERYVHTQRLFDKNKWLQIANQRLKWLSNNKTPYVSKILKTLKNFRTLTFCNNIAQTELLGKYCINSKNTSSQEYLDSFNLKKIKHITSCNMLNEGVNLTDCQYGIYAYISNSDIVIKQRMGRILRHPNPVLVIPYFVNTREEKILKNKMLKDYNPELIRTIYTYSELLYHE